MDGTPSKTAAAGGGAPAPFLLKTYDMVDDSITDEIVSWSSTRNSFVVWNPPEFARLLLPNYFKHNNFSSFIRQLNTYGFRKIDPERWEFANEDFVKDQKHLLGNIHRRKPIHSHSNPQGSPIDPERAAFEEEIGKLTQQKTALENSVSRFKQHQPATKLQLEDLTQRVNSIEQRQNNLLMIMEKAVQNPEFVDLLARKLELMDFSAYNKKQRFALENHSPFKPEFGNVFHHDFADKLKLELSSTVSDINLVSHSTQSSIEDGGSPQVRFSGGQMTPGGLPLVPEQQELLDTGASFTFNMDSCAIPSLHIDEEAGHIPCELDLCLASCVESQVNASQSTDRTPQSVENIGKASYLSNIKINEQDFRVPERNRNPTGENVTLFTSQENNDQVSATGQAPVNDTFWEQFLTEKPKNSP